MERHQSIDAMTGMKLYGARRGLARREHHPVFESSPPCFESTLSGPILGRAVTQVSGLDERSMDRAELLGLSFDAVTMETAVARCVEFCDAPRASHVVITANASHLCMIRHNAELAAACRAAHLTVADGMPVVWALRASGQPAPERVPGVDLMDRLLAAAAKHGLSVYFLGARREVVETLVKNSLIRYPGLEIAGFRDGYFGPIDHQAIVEEIRASGAHILFVGMPSPFKETWCQRHRELLDVPVIMGVGGSFDVLAGYIRRAPRWMQTAGLEWFWRLLMEPRKLWRRYLTTNSEFIWLAGREIVARRWGRQLAHSAPPITRAGREP
jgi:N-acetylglucosaminyldiphosphoundecaprenol N-acetyl-beta-D-mannosaminyltransferase